MNDEVAVQGGNLINVLGTRLEVISFFEKIANVLEESELAMPLITDRLYKKYITQSENQLFLEDLCILVDLFKKHRIKESCYFTYFNKIEKAVIEAQDDYDFCLKEEIPYEYQPVMIISSSVPYSVIQGKIPLEVRDNLTDEDLPFWQQTDVIDLAVKNKWI